MLVWLLPLFVLHGMGQGRSCNGIRHLGVFCVCSEGEVVDAVLPHAEDAAGSFAVLA